MWLKNDVRNTYFDIFFYSRLFKDKRANLGPLLTQGPGQLSRCSPAVSGPDVIATV